VVETEEKVPVDALAWFPNALRTPVAELFAARRRIPQESLGTRVLRQRHARWLEALGITEAFHPEVVLLDLGPLGAVGCDDQVGSEVFG
jgi:hypothetical protein